MLSALATVLVVLFLFSLTIFVHELGHFLAARASGLVVETFSIGFGPALWKRRYRGVLYKIGCLPVGGYVALPQLDPTGMRTLQGTGGEALAGSRLPPAPPVRRIAVSLAGAAGNLLLAVVLAWVVYLVGKPATPAERSATVGYVDETSPAYAAGLRIGDEIRAVNGESIRSWLDFLLVCSRYTNVTLTVQRGVEQFTISVPTEKGVLGQQAVRGVDGRSLCMVLAVDPGLSAARAGLQPGDIIIGFDGVDVISRAQLIALVQERRGRTVPITVRRGKERLTMPVTPEYDPATDQVRIGVQFNVTDIEFDEVVHPSPWGQVRGHALAIFKHLAALATPGQARAASGSLGGPLAILINYYYIVRTSLMVAVFFTGFVNVNLAILNLLPLPVLDGGHILFALWELIVRRPLPAAVINWATNVFAALLIAVLILLTGRDLRRFTPVGRLFQRESPPTAAAPAGVTAEPTPLTNAPPP